MFSVLWAPIVRPLFIVFALLISPATLAQEEPWIGNFPTVEYVLAQTSGRNEIETLARQQAALRVLLNALNEHIPSDARSVPPRTEERRAEYKSAELQVYKEAKAQYQGDDWREYFDMTNGFRYDKRFAKDVIDDLAPAVAKSLRALREPSLRVDTSNMPDGRSRQQLEGKKIDAKLALGLVGAIFLLLGVFIAKIGVNKRERLEEYEFENRSAGGAVEFNTYKDSKKHEVSLVRAQAIEKVGGLLCVLSGLLLMIVGIVTFT